MLRELFATGAAALLEGCPRCGPARRSATRAQGGVRRAPHAPKVSPEEGVLDFANETATALRDKVRGFAGWPGTKGAFAVKKRTKRRTPGGVTLKIITARVFENGDPLDAEAGGVLRSREAHEESMRVPCAGGTWLEVTEVQPPGKKAMDAASYANGLKGAC